MTRIVTISDTHELHESLGTTTMPKGDILIHAGDFTNMGHPFSIANFGIWLNKLDYKHKIVIAGNHDILFEKDPFQAENILKRSCPSVHYLMESEIMVEGIRIWGSPYSPEFMNWAFNVSRGKIKEKWDKIPEGLDILLTHGPPSGDLGGVLPHEKEDVGDIELKGAILKKRPKIHICGHIHEGYGERTFKKIKFINAALYSMGGYLSRNPIVFDY